MAGRPAHRLLVVPQRRQALEKLVLHATGLRIPIVEVEGGTLTALTGFDGHQGVALVVAARRYADPDEILARATARSEPAFVLVLDSLEDPQNVGTLLRSAEAAGSHGVIFPTKRQAPLTPAAVKASAGAVEHLLLAPVDDLAASLADLHARGLRIVGADADATLTVREADLRGPLALVVGSEGQGLGPAVRRRCDLLVRIPMRGAVGSLNASVAGSILLYEATTQRGGMTAGGPVAAGPSALDTGQRTTEPGPAQVHASHPEPGPAQVHATAPEAGPEPEPAAVATPARPGRSRTKRTAGPPPTAETPAPDRPPGGELLPGGPDPGAVGGSSGPGTAATLPEHEVERAAPSDDSSDASVVPADSVAGEAPAPDVTRPKAKKSGAKAAAKAAKRDRKSVPPVAKGDKGKARAKGAAADRG